jgi:hypothetical protein
VRLLDSIFLSEKRDGMSDIDWICSCLGERPACSESDMLLVSHRKDEDRFTPNMQKTCMFVGTFLLLQPA